MSLEIVSRVNWGGRDARRTYPFAEPVLGICWHCLGDQATFTAGDARMRQVQNFHMDAVTPWKGQWSDISYNMSICLEGGCYEAKGLDPATGGSFSEGKGHNYHWISVLLQISTRDLITSEMKETMLKLTNHIASVMGWRADDFEHKGHRELEGVTKPCPGDHAMAAVEELRSNNNGIYTPPPPVEHQFEARSDWAAEAIKWAIDNGISDGHRPREAATREEVLTLLHRASRLG